MRKSKFYYISNISLYRISPRQLAYFLQLPVRIIYTLRNNRLRHGNAPEVINDLRTMPDFDFLCRYGMRKHEIQKGRKGNFVFCETKEVVTPVLLNDEGQKS